MEKELKQKIIELLKKFDETVNPCVDSNAVERELFKNVNDKVIILFEENQLRIYDENNNHVMYSKGERNKYYFLAYQDEQFDVKMGHYISLNEDEYEKVIIYVGGHFDLLIEYIINKNLIKLKGTDEHKPTLAELEILFVVLEKSVECANTIVLKTFKTPLKGKNN